MIKRFSNNKGFTLLEVVISLILVGLVVGAIFDGFSISLRNISKMDVYNAALQFAQNKMNEYLLDDSVYTNGSDSGSWNDRFRWDATFETHEIDDIRVDKSRLSTRLLYIKLTVYYKFFGKERKIKLFTIKLVPKPKIGQQGYF